MIGLIYFSFGTLVRCGRNFWFSDPRITYISIHRDSWVLTYIYIPFPSLAINAMSTQHTSNKILFSFYLLVSIFTTYKPRTSTNVGAASQPIWSLSWLGYLILPKLGVFFFKKISLIKTTKQLVENNWIHAVENIACNLTLPFSLSPSLSLITLLSWSPIEIKTI